MNQATWDLIKPIAAQFMRDFLRTVGTYLAAKGLVQGDAGVATFIGAGMALAGLFWGWFTTKGYVQVGALLQKLTAAHSKTDAVEKAQAMPAADPAKVASSIVKAAVSVLLVAFACSLFLAGSPAMAQVKLKTPGQIVRDIEGVNQQAKAAVTGQPAPTSTAPLPCTFQMLTKLTPGNLLPTINSCIAGKLVSDTQRALTSAMAYGTSGKGDVDAINCLTPALAIFQAGVEIPAVLAVTAADGTVMAPAVPAQDPGPILLYQKYREFTLSGALTSCQSWFNGPINATAAAGLGAAATAVGAAAVFVPK